MGCSLSEGFFSFFRIFKVSRKLRKPNILFQKGKIPNFGLQCVAFTLRLVFLIGKGKKHYLDHQEVALTLKLVKVKRFKLKGQNAYLDSEYVALTLKLVTVLFFRKGQNAYLDPQ